MYGLVNRALEGLIRTQHGDDIWNAIKARAGIDIEVFIRMDSYPDEITYKLVGAAAEVLQQPADALLRAFGEYWTLYTGREGYGMLLDAAGSTLQELLVNLNDLHMRVGLMYPDLKPPSFYCTDVTPQGLLLHYESHRAGLAPMVIGLVEGMAKHFNIITEIEHVQKRDAGADHDCFRVQILPKP